MVDFTEKFDMDRIGIANHVKRIPDREALVMGNQRITYEELYRCCNSLANGLLALGIQPGDRIGVFMHNCPEFLQVWTAAGKIAVTPIPLNYRFRAEELAYIMNDSESKALVYGSDMEPVVTEAKPRFTVPGIRYICVGEPDSVDVLTLEELTRSNSEAPPEVDVGTHAVAPSLAYTSGTTGRPKGVLRGSSKRLNGLLGYAYTFEAAYDDVHLVAGPLYHAAPFGWAAYSLLLGNTVVIMPRFDAEDFLRHVQEHAVTSTFVVPTMLNRIIHLPEAVRNRYNTASLRVITAAAESFPFPLKQKVISFFGEGKLFEFYGGTEISLVTYLRPEEQLKKPGSCGRPAMGSSIKLLNENHIEVQPGEVGILYVKSPFLLDEYYRNPEATEACYHKGYFTVGDMARVDEDGYYYIVDRAVDMIISGGVNIYPAEIEEVLYRHPDILDAGIIGAKDPEWGEKIVAYVILKPGARIGEGEVKEYVAQNLATYKKPREVFFVDQLPYSPSGKLLKRELRKDYEIRSAGSEHETAGK